MQIELQAAIIHKNSKRKYVENKAAALLASKLFNVIFSILLPMLVAYLETSVPVVVIIIAALKEALTNVGLDKAFIECLKNKVNDTETDWDDRLLDVFLKLWG